ncbi:MAG TPA: uridine kinase [Lachnoclostridium phytofermentans]|uniref:Uridine kinase n=1 Tax=Lachnoclostridium phytofermentans TaxID=66219 RepID=A0A3D2X1J2_9FIRM|nr:kinase [Lachnoclostridium sp.]HCL00982.1 uridine kinase [Lachnoclostridium phytofermentans]
MSSHTKLIILRGNSGSGKSTTAKALQKKFGYGTMLISQDVIRRELLYVKDGIDTKAIPLLIDLAAYGRKNCEVVIIEGILNATWYQGLFTTLLSEYDNNIYAYYFDLPFEETLIRHMKKPNCNDFGEAEMRKWWMEKDYIGIIKEKIIRKELSLDEIVSMIYSDIIRGY